MAWLKYPISFLLFYIFALLQASFFAHFNIFGAVPDLIFILFFILLFFSDSHASPFSLEKIFYAVVAGTLLDVFSYSYFGSSVVILLAEILLFKKLFNSLQVKEEKYPIGYFLFIYAIFFLIYTGVSALSIYFKNRSLLALGFSWMFLSKTVYDLFVAAIGFYIYKKLFVKKSVVRRF